MTFSSWLGKLFARKSPLAATSPRCRTGKGGPSRRAVLAVELLDSRIAPSVTSIGVFDASTATWSLRNTSTAGGPDAGQFAYGAPNSTPVTGDWNGDGTTTVGVVEQSNGMLLWELRNSNTPGAPDITFTYGAATDIPVVGDWTGDGTTTIGVYDPNTGTWMLRNSNSAGAPDITFTYGGLQGMVPVTGDWNGDGTTTVGVVQTNGDLLTWMLRNSNSAGAPDITPFAYGAAGFVPVTGDWDGDGTWTPGAFDQVGEFGEPAGSWYITNVNSNGTGVGPATPFAFGDAGSLPVAGHWTARPTLDPIADTTVNENAGPQTVNLTGITAGGGETQALAVTATSSNPALIPTPTVSYTSPNTSGSLSFTPAPIQSGTATITVTVRDAGGDGILGNADDDAFSRTFTVTVTPNNQAPTGANNTVTTLEDQPYTFKTADFGFSDANDSPPNNFLAVKVTTLPTAGTLTDNGTAVTAGASIPSTDIAAGDLVFTPATNGNGTPYASFTFQVQDDGGTANGGVDTDPSPKTMTVNVTSVNNAPTGANNTVTTLEDNAYTFQTGDFGFSDPNDSPPNNFLAVVITTLPAAGTLTLNGLAVTAGQFVSVADIMAGNLRFTPAANANGSPYTSFTFQVQDDGGTANGGVNLDPSPKTMTVNVISVNDPPTGTNNTVTTTENTPYAFQTGDFGFSDPNDSPPNNFLAVKIATLPTVGTLTDNGTAVTAGQFVSVADITPGKLVFTPTANASGSPFDSFTFNVQDDGGTANGGGDLDPTPKTMTINVTPV